MVRKIKDSHVEKIKEMLSKDYKTVSIKDIMEKNYNVKISSSDVNMIKKGVSYKDVKPELNNKIKLACKKTNIDEQKIHEIKWALSEKYSTNEILKEYNVTNKELMHIKYGYSPYYAISPEFNDKIAELTNSKKINISNDIVIALKKEYVDRNGQVFLNDIAAKHGIDKATVSTILSFKCYKEIGLKFNSKIVLIKEKKKCKKEMLRREKLERNIRNEKLKLESQRKKQIETKDKIKLSISKINLLRELR